MDAVFGKGSFRNEIVWYYKGNSIAKKLFPSKHDTLLYYVSQNPTFNPIYVPYAEATLRRYNHTDEDGRRYKISALRDGKQEKVYMGDGKMVDSVWDIPVIRKKNERTGYPTQKPLALLDRIIKASSNKGDVVFDPFCGCATTLVAADRLQRDWIGIDISGKAAELVVERIKADQGLFQEIIARTDIPKRTDLGNIPRYNAPANKTRLYGEQSGYCNGCGTHFEKQHLEVDHIIAENVGGTDHIENLQLLCSHCNRIKGERGQEYLISRLNKN